MFDKQDIYFYHHVHGLEQIFREIAFLEEEGVEAVMEVVLKIIQRADFGKHPFGYLFVAAQYLFECVVTEFHPCLQVQKFAERKTAEVVALHDVTQFQVFFFEPHDGRTGEYNLQVGETVVAHT